MCSATARLLTPYGFQQPEYLGKNLLIYCERLQQGLLFGCGAFAPGKLKAAVSNPTPWASGEDIHANASGDTECLAKSFKTGVGISASPKGSIFSRGFCPT